MENAGRIYSAFNEAGVEKGRITTSKTQDIEIWNLGSLGREVLTMGNTTKRMRGQSYTGGHGEGLKVGALALVRSGFRVVIEMRAMSWSFELDAEDQFHVMSRRHKEESTEPQDAAIVRVLVTASAEPSPAGLDQECQRSAPIFVPEDYLFLCSPEQFFESQGGQRDPSAPREVKALLFHSYTVVSFSTQLELTQLEFELLGHPLRRAAPGQALH